MKILGINDVVKSEISMMKNLMKEDNINIEEITKKLNTIEEKMAEKHKVQELDLTNEEESIQLLNKTIDELQNKLA
jgi:cob(I)alamin adenosyltransferase